jgi:hypothetical protein
MAPFSLLLTFLALPTVYSSAVLGLVACAILAHWLPRST